MAKPHDMSAEEWALRKEFNESLSMAREAWGVADKLRVASGDPNLINAYEETGRVMQERMWTVLGELTQKYIKRDTDHK